VKRLLAFLAFCLIAAGQSAPVEAHASSTSFVILEAPAADGAVTLRWDMSLVDLSWLVFIDSDIDGIATWDEVKAAEGSIARAALTEISLRRGGVPCVLTLRDLALAERVEQNFLSLAFTTSCPRAGLLEIGGTLFMQGDAAQRVLVSMKRGAETLTGVIGSTTPGWTEPERANAWQSFVRFIGEGIWHVLIGYDHIAFVLLLLLPSVLRAEGGEWRGTTRLGEVARDLVTIVTAFTVAHSITLALAVTGTVRLPTQPIEIAIAASIAVAGFINLVPKLARLRLGIAFGFGLVHGFGFANVLGELDAGGVGMLPLLGGFNIGVEVAQLSIVALVLPAIYFARCSRWYSAGVMPLGSCVLAGMGLVWMVQRAMG
jgi:hypothetical protein